MENSILFAIIANNYVQLKLNSIMIYKLQTGKVLPIIRKIAKPISTAERLGIPKALRSSPKALEDPYYWGYQQWNSRYNAAVNSGNIQEAQRLRDLHFKIKAPNTKVVNENDTPLEVYHFTSNPSIKKFRPSSGRYTSIIWFTSDPTGKGIYYPHDARESQSKLHTYLNLKTPGVEIHRENPDSWDTNDFYKTFRISPLKKERADALQKRLSSVDSKIVDAYRKKDIPLYNKLEAEQDYLESNLFRRPYQTLSGKQWQIFDLDLPPQKYLYDAMIESGADGLIHNVGNTKHYLSFDPTQIKFSDPITYDDNGNIISIVKRDNFHNPDMRYKQGGIIKLQAAGIIPKLKRSLEVISKKGSEAVKTLTKDTNKVPITIETVPDSHRIFRATVYKGGSIRDPYFSFFTTDPEYARQYGPVNKYILEQKGPVAIAKEPMIGSRDVVENDMFIARNTKDVSGAKIILGHDLITSDIPIKSKGLEILSTSMPSSLTLVSDPKAATTYHFDGKMPLSKSIGIAEKAGIPKGDRGLFNWDQIPDLIPRFNKWAQYYGYETIPESTFIQDAVNIMKNTFKRHNTFFRGVHNPDIPEDASRIEALFGKDYDIDDVYKYVATHGRPGDNAVFISPLSNAGIYGSTGKTAIVRRRFKLGKNPETWLHDADFDIIFGGSPKAIKAAQEKNTFTFPWSERGHGTVENELLAPDGTINFVDFVPQNASTSYFDLNGSLNKYLGYKSFHDMYGFGDYNRFTDVPIEKPKFKQGGKI